MPSTLNPAWLYAYTDGWPAWAVGGSALVVSRGQGHELRMKMMELHPRHPDPDVADEQAALRTLRYVREVCGEEVAAAFEGRRSAYLLEHRDARHPRAYFVAELPVYPVEPVAGEAP